MYVYVPNNVPPATRRSWSPCTTAPARPGLLLGRAEFASLADQYGFIVIYPSATRSGSCFDVSSPQALKHDGSSDPVGIVSMVRYVRQQYHDGDASRVYVTGASSGAMMTNVLLGDYPDVFKAGAAFMGVPFACFATTDGSSGTARAPTGRSPRPRSSGATSSAAPTPATPVRGPRMQLWHGTADTTLQYPNFGEEIKQWTNVLGVSQTPVLHRPRRSRSWTRTRYGTTPAPGAGRGDQRGQGGRTIALVGGMAAMRSPSSASTAPTPDHARRRRRRTRHHSPSPTHLAAAVRRAVPRQLTRVNAWNTGLTATITITNTGTAPVNGWSLAFTLPAARPSPPAGTPPTRRPAAR